MLPAAWQRPSWDTGAAVSLKGSRAELFEVAQLRQICREVVGNAVAASPGGSWGARSATETPCHATPSPRHTVTCGKTQGARKTSCQSPLPSKPGFYFPFVSLGSRGAFLATKNSPDS